MLKDISIGKCKYGKNPFENFAFSKVIQSKSAICNSTRRKKWWWKNRKKYRKKMHFYWQIQTKIIVKKCKNQRNQKLSEINSENVKKIQIKFIGHTHMEIHRHT